MYRISRFRSSLIKPVAYTTLICFVLGVAAVDADALAPSSGARNPLTRCEYDIATRYHAGQIAFAESPEDRAFLEERNATRALFLSHGKILVHRSFRNKPADLARVIIHEQVEAIMQIMARFERSKYAALVAMVLACRVKLPAGYARADDPAWMDLKTAFGRLFPGEARSYITGQPLDDELLANHIVAKAIELILARDDNLLAAPLSAQETLFLGAMERIILANRHLYFTGIFWDASLRAARIRLALANGMRFVQAANGRMDTEPAATSAKPEPAAGPSVLPEAGAATVPPQAAVPDAVDAQKIRPGGAAALSTILPLAVILPVANIGVMTAVAAAGFGDSLFEAAVLTVVNIAIVSVHAYLFERAYRLNAAERRQAVRALRESEQNYRALFDTVDDIIIVGDYDGRIVYVNPAVSAKLGYSRAELIGMRFADLHPADKRDEAAAIIAAMLKGEKDRCPLPLLSKSGAIMPVETRVWFGKWNGKDCIFGISKDLTREQDALQKFDRFFRSNPAPMAVTRLPDRAFTDINDAFLMILGYSREEVLGKTSAELGLFVDPEQQREVREELSRSGTIAERELKVRRKDGVVLDGLFSGEVVASQGERYFLTVMIDQTMRKRAEQEHLQALEMLRKVLSTSQDMIFVKDHDLRTVLCNDSYAAAVDKKPEELYGKTDIENGWPAELVMGDPARNRKGFRDDDLAVLRGEERRSSAEEGYVRGRRVVFDTLKLPLRASDGTVIGVLGISRDITEQKAMEDELRKSHDILRKFSEQVPGALYQFILYPDGAYGISFVSAEVERVFGVTQAEVRANAATIFARVYPEDRGALMTAITRSAHTLQTFHHEFRIEHPTKGLRWVLGHSRPERLPDGRIVWYGFMSDITDRKKADEATILLAKNEAIGLLAAGIAHDFNNVLQAAKLATEAIPQSLEALGLPPDRTQGIVELTGLANAALARGVAIAGQLLTFARGGKAAKEICYIRKMIEKTTLLACSGSAIKSRLALADDLWPVHADSNQLSQVVQNLVVNARDVMPQGGVVSVAADNFTVHDTGATLMPGKYVRIVVRDEGPGIAQEHMAKIFEPYFTTKPHGHGIGLAACKSIVADHGGLITVESRPGEGAVFAVYIPAVEGPVVDAARETPGRGQMRLYDGKRVLVLDDEEMIRRPLVMQLERLGFEVEEAVTGEEAIERYTAAREAGRSFDLAIFDLTIPGGMQGREAFERLKQYDPAIRAIVSSGYSEDATGAEYAAVGFLASLPKPYGLKDLKQKIEFVLGAGTDADITAAASPDAQTQSGPAPAPVLPAQPIEIDMPHPAPAEPVSLRRIGVSVRQGATAEEQDFVASMMDLEEAARGEFGAAADEIDARSVSCGMAGQSIILYADDLLNNAALVDLEQTVRGLSARSAFLSGGKIVLYAEKRESAAFVAGIIRHADPAAQTVIITRDQLQSSDDDVKVTEALIRMANAKGAGHALGIIRGPSRQPEELTDFAKDTGLPIVIVGPEQGVYSFAQALAMVIEAKMTDGAARGWVIPLPLVTSFSDDIIRRYERYQRALAVLMAA